MSVLLPELLSFGPQVRVPTMRDVRLTSRVQAIVDHPDFQRLRRVRQLGPTHLVYPGAVHSRFEHSLGAYDYVCRFLVSLLRNPSFSESVTEQDLLTVLAAGLCHDVGHYPFAHSLEALHRRGRDTPRHEDLSGELIQNSFGLILEKQWQVDPQRVVRLICTKHNKQPSSLDSILASIISSAIDADKMDYLERDSAHMGVPYGRSFDSGRLIASLTLNESENSIAITAKGKVSAEMFVFSRYMMFSEAYWHHTVRSASAMLEAALADHVGRLMPDPDDLKLFLLATSDNELLNSIFVQAPPSSVAARLLQGLTGNRRSMYKRVATFSRVYAEDEKRAAYEALYGMDSNEIDAVVS